MIDPTESSPADANNRDWISTGNNCYSLNRLVVNLEYVYLSRNKGNKGLSVDIFTHLHIIIFFHGLIIRYGLDLVI